ncbi:MAG: zinc-binding dehydrogenase, partial [Novosphingobium sp.]
INATTSHIGEALRELTGGHGADVIFDPVGGEPSDEAVQGMAWGGRLVLIGISAGFPTLNPLDMIGRTYSVIGAALPNRTVPSGSRLLRTWINSSAAENSRYRSKVGTLSRKHPR